MTFTHALATNNYGEAKFIVSTSAANGTHTTLATAMSAASSGDTIFLRDSVTENVTITPGVNIAAWSGGSLNVPTITGTLTMTGAGTSTISGIKLTTNSATIISITGSAASILNVFNCYLNCSNNSGIVFSTSSASALLNIEYCTGDLGTTGINLFAHSGAGGLRIYKCDFNNSGGSSTANTHSSGSLQIEYSRILNPVTLSGTGTFGAAYSLFNTQGQNVIALTVGGSAANVSFCIFNSGTNSSITISTTLTIEHSSIGSTNTNSITGAGAILYSGLTFSGSSTTINTTTQTGAGTLQGSKNTAPTAGFLGQQLTANATAVATTSAAAKTITSVSLTAGVWDVTGVTSALATGGTQNMIASQVGISATDNTLSGTAGVDYFQTNVTTTNSIGGIAPLARVVISTTTTYYLVVINTYTSTTCPTNGRITATRVG